jgi:hypothetical protein
MTSDVKCRPLNAIALIHCHRLSIVPPRTHLLSACQDGRMQQNSFACLSSPKGRVFFRVLLQINFWHEYGTRTKGPQRPTFFVRLKKDIIA